MTFIQIVVLIWAVSMIAAIAFVRGADARVDRRLNEIERRKKRINWPASH